MSWKLETTQQEGKLYALENCMTCTVSSYNHITTGKKCTHHNY